jgi:hypothetical protein
MQAQRATETIVRQLLALLAITLLSFPVLAESAVDGDTL